jgi:hypothetical protein
MKIISLIFIRFSYVSLIRNSVTGPLTACPILVDNLGQAVRTQLVDGLFGRLATRSEFFTYATGASC